MMKRCNSFIFKLLNTCIIAMFMATSAFAIETDRTWYLVGETMKVSVTDNDALIAYAELCDTHGLVAGVVVGLQDGKGTGIIELPSNLHSGYYLLSVYTRHNAKVSQQLVAVINPLRKSADDDIEWVEITQNQKTYPQPLFVREGRGYHANSDSLPSEYFLPSIQGGNRGGAIRETEGHIIMARIKNVYDGNTFRASQICPSLSIVGKQIHYFEGKMVDDSTAVFYTYGIHGKLPLVLSAMSSNGVSLPVELISPFAALIPKQLPHLVFHYKRSEVEARSLDMQRLQSSTFHSPLGSAARLRQEPSSFHLPPSTLDYDETVLGTKPDLTYNLDEYRQFLTIREVLIEYVNCVKDTKIEGVPRLMVRREQETYNSTLPTLVLIDGMPVFDVERLLNYDARRIHYINIYAGQYTFGVGVYNGILSFVTRSGRLTNYPTERNMQYLVYDFPS
jgi:hypothetical protein